MQNQRIALGQALQETFPQNGCYTLLTGRGQYTDNLVCTLCSNADPRTLRDESLWARYHLATFYERNGQAATARQIYRKHRGERNGEDLHQQVQRRLARLQ